MKFYVMWFIWKLVMFYWEDHDNLIKKKLFMMVLPTKLPSLINIKSLYFILWLLLMCWRIKSKWKTNQIVKKKSKSQNLSLKDESEVWELGVPSHKVTQKEAFLAKNSLKHCLLTEQPPYLLLCKGIPTCAPSNESESKGLSPQIEKLLKELDDVFPNDGPTGLPPF